MNAPAPAALRRCRYQDQDSPLTLREGLDEYRAANPALVDPAASTDKGAAFFASHDACHVVFGTTTAILDEATTDLWTFFGVAITPASTSASS